MTPISPQNLAAQLVYRARGNPPSTSPDTAAGNTVPGLEVDFRNVWRRIFVGLELHEARPFVIKVDGDAPADIKCLLHHYLVTVEGIPVCGQVKGPRVSGGPSEDLGTAQLVDWSNVLAPLVLKAGDLVQCTFVGAQSVTPIHVSLCVRSLLDQPADTPAVTRPTIAREALHPGELTQGLCSPWPIPSPKLGVLSSSLEMHTVEPARASVKCRNG